MSRPNERSGLASFSPTFLQNDSFYFESELIGTVGEYSTPRFTTEQTCHPKIASNSPQTFAATNARLEPCGSGNQTALAALEATVRVATSADINSIDIVVFLKTPVVRVNYYDILPANTALLQPHTAGEAAKQMKALRILHSESSKGWGGQEHRTLKEMTVLRARGHSVEVVCPIEARLGVRAKEEGFVVHHARMRGGADIPSMLTIKTLLSRRKFDVLNTHSGHDSIVAGTAGRLAGTPLVVRTRHLALPISSLATYTWIPHRVIAVSRHVRDYLISAGVAKGRVETIYDGIVRPDALTHSTLRTELGLGADAIIAGMVAIVRDKKGHEDLIDAVQPMLADRPNLHVVMAGDGPWFDKIRNIVDGMGLGDRIHLLGFRTDVPNVLRGCDFFVLPTHQEALGQSYIEAMAAGLPVIGTDVDGVPELIAHGVNGLLVPPHDIVALRAAIARLIDNPKLRTQLGVAGRLLTDASFTVDGMADETIDFYRRGIRERRAHA